MKTKLRRELGLFEATMYGVGIILGAGIYALIGEAAGIAGNAVWISFIIGAVVASFTGLSYAELSTMFPKAAAEYVYVRKAYGSKFLAFIIGWLLVFAGAVSAAAVALGFSGYLHGLVGKSVISQFTTIGIQFSSNSLIILFSLVLISILSFINFKGIKESSKFNVLFTLVEAAGLIFVIIIALPHLGSVNYFSTTSGFKGIFSAAALIFFAYLGFEEIANIAEETKKPKRVVPLALILSIVITTAIYVLTAVSCVSLSTPSALSASESPLALCASSALGDNAYLFISFIALFATTNTVLAILIMTSRMMYGMAVEKSLPEYLAKVHVKTKTPWKAILVIMFFSMLFLFIGDIVSVANITSLLMFIAFAVVNLSLIWLRLSMPKMKRAFRTPINIRNYPVLAFAGVFLSLFMIFQFDWQLILLGAAIASAGAIFYRVFIERLK